MTDQQIIKQCIERVSRTKYPGGGWQAERACVVALDGKLGRELYAATGIVFGTNVSFNCAAAARRIGEWLRTK